MFVRAPSMTTDEARDTIARLAHQAGPLRTNGVAPQPWIEDYNAALLAFVPRDKMPLLRIGTAHYVGDRSRPGAFVPSGCFRQLVDRARTDFDTLLVEWQREHRR